MTAPPAKKQRTEQSDEGISKIYFFSRSADKLPGEGTHEIWLFDKNMFKGNFEDKPYTNWRQHLSNFDALPFKWSGKRFNTIEHAFQYAKIRLVDATKADEFTLDSESELGKADGLKAQKNRRMVILTDVMIGKWNTISKIIMASAALEKYLQNAGSLSSHILKLTQDAELWHIVSRQPKPDRFQHLEEIRKMLKDGMSHNATNDDHWAAIVGIL
tara:strand:+ start:47 stop:691 length:645 start_codon:yes stop_codon:yes gene_type:complete